MALAANRVRLGVNIDHVATLRQARKEIDPDPVAAALVCKSAGADMIVAHLRQDRRHMQDSDLIKLCKLRGETHLEISSDPKMVSIALKSNPDSVCIVPEDPDELTTEGGLDLKNSRNAKAVDKAVRRLRADGIEVSLFVNPDAVSVRLAKRLGADTVELCTTKYAESQGKNRRKGELEKLALAATLADEMGLNVHAGHGLDFHNAQAVSRLPHVAALNIGYSIVARSLFVGLKKAVAEMKLIIS